MFKSAVYKKVIRPVLSYGRETLALRKYVQIVLEGTGITMLRLMMGNKED